MYRQLVNTRKQRLYVTFEGSLSVADLQASISEVRELVKPLVEGFDMITDISRAHPFAPEVAEALGRAQEVLVSLGLRRVVRVIGSRIAELQFMRTGRQAGLEPVHVATLSEAERLLDKPPTRAD